jgi:hypothetical protein
MKMILNSKEDCVASITRALERTSLWRKAITGRWPDDPRNMRAAKLLDQLALDASIASGSHLRIDRCTHARVNLYYRFVILHPAIGG